MSQKEKELQENLKHETVKLQIPLVHIIINPRILTPHPFDGPFLVRLLAGAP